MSDNAYSFGILVLGVLLLLITGGDPSLLDALIAYISGCGR